MYKPPPPKAGEIKIADADSLPKLALVNLNVKKPEPVKTGAQLKKEAEIAKLKQMVAFDIDKEYD